MTALKAAPAKRGEPAATGETPHEHVHGPDCDHDHADAHAGHVHGPDCHHDHQHAEFTTPYRREAPKLGRNDPCFCGSGRKYKKCHGAHG